MTDEFDKLDQATPVRDEDSLTSNVQQPEADGLREAAGIRPIDTSNQTTQDSQSPCFVAHCRHCQRGFSTTAQIESHDCDETPIAACPYCKEHHPTKSDIEDHLYQCDEFRRVRIKAQQSTQVQSDASGTSAQFGQYIEPWYHELKAYVKYDCSSKPEPLRSYEGFRSLASEHDLDQDDRLRLTLSEEFDGLSAETLAVEFTSKSSGIAPPDNLSAGITDPQEYQIYLYPQQYESHADAASDGQQRVYFRLSPRWPGITSESGTEISNPHDITGFDIEYSGSNIPFGTYPELLHSAVRKLQSHQSSSTSSAQIRAKDVHPRNIHKSSNVTDAELYVRVDHDRTEQVYAIDGTLHRLSLLLSDERSGYAKSVRDDRECPGHYHVATLGPDRVSKMVPGHRWPREHKHYHVKHPKAIEGGPLEHPKISVSLQSSLSSDTPKWSELARLERELDEALLNVLKWSDLPVRPDHQVYVPDDHFEVTGSRRYRKLLHDQLPRIESMQEREVKKLAVAGNATQTDVNMLETLLTNGGQQSPSSLAEQIGCAVSTVYSSIQRLGKLVSHEYGNVQLASQYVGQQIVKHIEAVKQTIDADLESAVDDLLRAEKFADSNQSDPWSLWLKNWVEDVRTNSDGPDELVLGYEPATRKDARELIRSGAGKWAQVTGQDWIDFADQYLPVVSTQDGEVWSPSRQNFLRAMPGFEGRYVA